MFSYKKAKNVLALTAALSVLCSQVRLCRYSGTGFGRNHPEGAFNQPECKDC